MRIKSIIFFVFVLIFHSGLKAQKTNTEHRIESKVLFLVINGKVFNDSMKFVLDNQSIDNLDSISIYNSYKNEFIPVKKFTFYMQHMLNDEITCISENNKLTTEMKKFLKTSLYGQIIFFNCNISINKIDYQIDLTYKVFKVKNNKIIKGTNYSSLSLFKPK
jgi:hypothetical protein